MKLPKFPIFPLISIILFLLSLTYCSTLSHSPVYEKDGKVYGEVRGTFRHRWWNYYERALSYAEGEFYSEAIKDIKEAVKRRDTDQRMARTYGMHFVDYFPHRELGVIFYRMGQYENAEMELEKSLSTVETGKANFYLNLTRKVITQQSGMDIAPPNIRVSSIADGETINRFHMMIEGVVEDDSYVHQISINQLPLFLERSEKKMPFSKELPLKKGLNEINISAYDILDKVKEKKLTVFADFEGPAISIDDYFDGQEIMENKIVLRGRLADATRLAKLELDGQTVEYKNEKNTAFQFPIDLKQGNNRLVFKAVDIAGNATKGELNLLYTPITSKISLAYNRKKPILVAYNRKRMFFHAEQNRFILAETARKSPSVFRLIIKDLTDIQTVYLDKIYIDGSAIGIHTIQSISINNEPLFIIPGKTIYFNQLVELQEGKNQFIIKAQDIKGATVSKTITIIRKVPKVRQIGSRMSLAILPFEEKSKLSLSGQMAYDMLVNAFIGQGRFNIVSRGEAIEAILREQHLSRTELVDKRTAIRVGRLIAAEAILTGVVYESEDFIEILARFIDTETSVVMEAKDVYTQDKSLSQLQYLSNGLALKFRHSFPLLEGLVIKVEKENITSDLGSRQGMKKEMRLIVFRDGKDIVHPTTGRELGTEIKELGIVKVSHVFNLFSIGRILSNKTDETIQVKDMVITK